MVWCGVQEMTPKEIADEHLFGLLVDIRKYCEGNLIASVNACEAKYYKRSAALADAIKAYGKGCFDAGFRHAGMGLPHPDHKTHGPDDKVEETAECPKY
jgi:hypothetical protein